MKTEKWKNAVVVVVVRDVHDWVEAMRRRPYHAPAHLDLEWDEFVTKEWSIDLDQCVWTPNLAGISRMKTDVANAAATPVCQAGFTPDQVIPCDHVSVTVPNHRGKFRPLYELNADGKPFSNILELRAAKLRNFASVGSFESVQQVHFVRYEDMVQDGTSSLIHSLEASLAARANCTPAPPQELKRQKYPDGYLEWMRSHVDWTAEALFGNSM